MKGKKLLSLISILASAAVVGTTFAIYAVSDEADPFGIKITPGSITPEGTPLVTLKYGSAPQKANINELENGKPRLAAIVDLLADTSDSTAYTGKFNLALVDETENKPANEAKLIDNLSVAVYGNEVEGVPGGEVTTDLSGLTPLGTLAKSSTEHSASISIEVTDSQAKRVYVVVSLEAEDPATLSMISNDNVGLTMDWAKGTNEDIEATPIYLRKALEDGQKAYVFAWRDSDKKANKEWPGVEMTADGSHLYSYLLSTTFDRVIFSIYNGDEKLSQTEDLEIITENRQSKTTYYLDSTHWGAKPDSSLAAAYYVKGSMNDWSANASWALVADAEDSNKFSLANVDLAENDELKVWGNELDNWFSCAEPYTDCHYSLNDGNVKVSESGNYTINFYAHSDNGNHIQLIKNS